MSPSAIHKARWAIALTFLVHGFVVGSWVPHIPLAKDRLDVGTGIFGVALLAIALGAIIAMPLSGALINRYGSARITTVTGIAMCFAFILPPLAPDLASFLVAAVVFGASIGSMDVAMNAHGVAVEKAMRRPTMSLLHGCFSMMDEIAHILLASGLCLALLLLSIRFFLPSAIDKGLSGQSFVWPTRATIGLGVL